jgi:Bax protein
LTRFKFIIISLIVVFLSLGFMKKPSQFYSLFSMGAILVLTALWGCGREKNYTIKTEIVKVDSISKIILITDSLVKPIIYTHVSQLENHPLQKQLFISAVLPSVLITRHHIEERKHKLEKLRDKKHWNKADSAFYLSTLKRYRARSLDDLLARVITLPNSIILAQAVMETGWGESRFFIQANNLFGIWSVREKEQRIAAGKTRKGKTIYLRSYKNISGSIKDYFEVLASARAYRNLRKARLQTSDPIMLLEHLKFYSEERAVYTRKLKKIIDQNDLTKYDHFKIDPACLTEVYN